MYGSCVDNGLLSPSSNNIANIEIDPDNIQTVLLQSHTYPYGVKQYLAEHNLTFDPNKLTDINFVLNSDAPKETMGQALTTDFVKMLRLFNTDLNVVSNPNKPIFEYSSSDLNTHIGDDFFNVSYGTVPLNPTDETYTYITFDGKANNNGDEISTNKIFGIKHNSTYVSLTNKRGNDLLDLANGGKNSALNYDSEKALDMSKYQYPLIINRYAAKKHGLDVGDTISVNINNSTDRYIKKINDDSAQTSVTFKVTGINETFVGEEYYTDQDVANYLLGLKSHINPNREPSSYYIDSYAYTCDKDLSGQLTSPASQIGAGNH
jgi:hypothetical protein